MSKALDIIKSLKEEQDYMSMDDPGAAIKKDYKVGKDGIIHEPGKFQAEMYYIVYYYDLVMNGFSSESGGDVESGGAWDFFEFDDEDYKKFPELKGKKGLILWQDSQGFISIEYSDTAPEDEYEEDEEDSEEGEEEHE